MAEPGAAPQRPALPRLRLRPTMLSDLAYVQSVEQDARNLPFITPWERTQHEAAVRIPDFRHFIVEGDAGAKVGAGASAPVGEDAVARDGFVILQGCRNPNRSVGRACVRQLKRLAFDDLRAHRFWLDVKSLNTRALALYADEGFVEEGRLRESVRLGGLGGLGEEAGYDTLVVMSLLDREYRARQALGLEA